MKNLLNIKNLIILFFITIIFLGFNLYQDYGVYFDNTYQRINAFLWYSYVKSFFLEPGLSLTNNLQNLIQQNNIETISDSTLPSLQPIALGLFTEFFIDLFNIEGSKNIYQFKDIVLTFDSLIEGRF